MRDRAGAAAEVSAPAVTPQIRRGDAGRADDLSPCEEVAAAEAAGLRYVSDAEPGIRRRRRGRGFEYLQPDGSRASDRDVERARSLAVPPAWTDVWICPDGRGHLQATGRDARGRKQYRYHGRWTEVRDEAKFERLARFGALLPKLRDSVAADLALAGLPRRKVTAAVVALLDRTLIRVGNDEYRRSNGTFGLTTLKEEHVEVDGSEICFRFVGKGGREHDVSLRDRRLARVVRRCHELGGQELFTFMGDDRSPVRVDSADCNEYLVEVLGVEATAKDFRTWGATTSVLRHLASAGPCEDGPERSEAVVVEAVDLAAERLGNTRAVCRRSYVHPAVPEAFATGALHVAWRESRRGRNTSRAERATLRLLRA